MGASFTGAPIYAKNTEVPVVAVEENSDEYITAVAKANKINESSDEIEIYLEEKLKTEAYQETYNIDI